MPLHRPGLLQHADLMGQQQGAVLTDLAHHLFPASDHPLSDREVAGVRRCLIDWVRAIETALTPEEPAADCSQSPFPRCWTPLSQSDLLNDWALLQETRLRDFLWQFGRHKATEQGQFPSAHSADAHIAIGRMAEMEDVMLADAAMKHGSAMLKDRHYPAGQLTELPIELLHMVAWRVVAAHEVIAPGSQIAMQPHVADLLARHDESRSLIRSAQHLAHKMMELHIADAERPLLQPAQYGMALTIALLTLASGFGFMTIGMMAMERGLPRLTVLLRAMGYTQEAAGGLLGWIVGRMGHEHAALRSLHGFAVITRDDAQAMVANWRSLPILVKPTS